MDQAFGIDVSQWQGSLDFQAIAEHAPKIQFMYLRTGAGLYQDPLFDGWWGEVGKLDICRAAYHYLYPSLAATGQIDILFRKSKPGENDRLVLDLEVDQGLERQQITDFINHCLGICRARTGRLPILYSRALWLNTYLFFGQLPEGLDLALAQYYFRKDPPAYTPEYPSPPSLPTGAKKWLIHQTTERGPGIGSESYYMDYNRWNGTRDAVRAYFGYQGEYQVFIPIVQAGAEIARVKESVRPWLNVRSQPWRDPVVGKLMPGERFEIKGTGIDDLNQTWYRLGEGKWVAAWLTERVS